MLKNLFILIVVTLSGIILFFASNSELQAAYNNECWVVSGGDTIWKVDSNDGKAFPNTITIPDVSQVEAVEVDPKTGIVWIAVKAANTVYRYDTETGDFKPVTVKGWRPQKLSINPVDGTVWGGGIDVINKVSADGSTILVTIKGVYEPDVSVNTADGSCWVTDSRGQKVSRYSAEGTLLTVPYTTLKEPKYVSVNAKTGNAWATDPRGNVIVKLNADGQELLRITDIDMPISPCANADDSVWLVSGNNTLMKLSADGSKLVEEPAGVVILFISVNPKDGTVWAADQLGQTFTGEVIKFSAQGQKIIGNPIFQPSYVSVDHWPTQ